MTTRKRSATLKLTTMLAGAASFSLSGCGDQPGSPTQWDRSSIAQGEQVEAMSYGSLEACKAANEAPDEDCDKAYAAALADDKTNAPRFDEQASCEDVYGAGSCVPRSASGGGSFFTPLLAGFVIGRLLDGGGNPYYRGTGLYRQDQRHGGGYYTGWGGGLSRDYNSGRTTIAKQGIDPPDAMRQAPPRMQTRTSVVSRGGFGGGRGYSAGG